MYVHNLNPTLLDLGPLEIRYYGLVYLFGFIILYFVLNYYRKKDKLNITKDDIYDLIFYLFLGVLIGSRIFHVFWELPYYIANPLKIFFIWEGGMAFHGGLVGVAIATYYFSKKKKISFAKLADIITIPAVFVLALGRIANFVNAELYGTLTNVSWCVKFPNVDGCRHPTQLYSALKRFAVLGILLLINKKKNKDGFLFWNMIILFGIGRFFIDFLREDWHFLGLSLGQYFSLIMFIVGIYVLIKYYKEDIKSYF